MNRFIISLIVALVLLSCSKNTPPTINTLLAEPDTVYPGDTVVVSFSVSDADGDALSVLFYSSQGTWIEAGQEWGSPVKWVAQPASGTCYLVIKVTDLEATVEDSVAVLVRNGGTFSDIRDNRSYRFIRIGQQAWMAENLAYLPAVSPPADGGYDEPFYYVHGYYGNDVSEAKGSAGYTQYGVLYNWKATQTACPDGWHLPSDADWQQLEQYLGMDEAELEETGDRNSGAVGARIKSVTGWAAGGNGNNNSGFNVFPGSSRNSDREFGTAGVRAAIRTASAAGSSGNFTRTLSAESNGISRGTANHSLGLSIRCLKND